MYCGPNFWAHYRNDPKIGSIEKGNIDFQVPQPDGRIILKNGKLIQSSNDFKIVWDKIAIDFNSHNLTIRKLNTSELKYYWSIIFFDIEEPVYVINSNSTTIIIDLSLDGMIQFIEIYKK